MIRMKKRNKKSRFVDEDTIDETPKMDRLNKIQQFDSSSKFDNLDLGEDTIDKMMMSQESNPADNVKELFNEDKVKARTDLSPTQIRNVTKAFYLANLTGMPDIRNLVHDFLLLRISKDRKSRQEFVDGLKAKIEQSIINGQQAMRGQFGK